MNGITGSSVGLICIILVFSAVPMIQNLETTLRAGAVPQAPQFRQSPVHPAPPVTNQVDKSSESSQSRAQASGEVKSKDKTSVGNDAAKPKAAPEEKPAADPLGDARSKVQEEIGKEFAAIMATGTFRASEAAALATKKVMQKYGQMNSAQS